MAESHPATAHLLSFFAHEHLPQYLREISEHCEALAVEMDAALVDGPEKTAGLRKLLEAKDCFVRQAVVDDQRARVRD